MKFSMMTPDDKVRYIKARLDYNKLKRIREAVGNDIDEVWTVINSLEIKYGLEVDIEKRVKQTLKAWGKVEAEYEKEHA